MQKHLEKIAPLAARTDISAPSAAKRQGQTTNITVSICVHVHVLVDERPALNTSASLRCDMPMT